MICKWCGNSMSPSETKCKRCGKEVPALSDCGGFYDLAPKAAAAEVPSAPASSTAAPSSYQPAKEPVPAKKSKINKKFVLALIATVSAIFVTLLVLVFVLLGKVGNLSDDIEELQDKVGSLQYNMKRVNVTLGFEKEEETKLPKVTVPESTTASTTVSSADRQDSVEEKAETTEPTQATTEPTLANTEQLSDETQSENSNEKPGESHTTQADPNSEH